MKGRLALTPPYNEEFSDMQDLEALLVPERDITETVPWQSL